MEVSGLVSAAGRAARGAGGLSSSGTGSGFRCRCSVARDLPSNSQALFTEVRPYAIQKYARLQAFPAQQHTPRTRIIQLVISSDDPHLVLRSEGPPPRLACQYSVSMVFSAFWTSASGPRSCIIFSILPWILTLPCVNAFWPSSSPLLTLAEVS